MSNNSLIPGNPVDPNAIRELGDTEANGEWDALYLKDLRISGEFSQTDGSTAFTPAEIRDHLDNHPSAPGVTAHNALTGLGDDDHPQYLNSARGDIVYAQIIHTHGSYSLTTHNHDAAYAEVSHTHGGYALSIHNHDAAYYTQSEVDSLLSGVTGGSGAVISVNGDNGVVNLTEDQIPAGAIYAKITQAEKDQYTSNIAAKADLTHTHGSYSLITHNHNTEYADLSHTHASYSLSTHNHDSRYYTETEIDAALNNKANSIHDHTLSSINNAGDMAAAEDVSTNGSASLRIHDGWVAGMPADPSGNDTTSSFSLTDRITLWNDTSGKIYTGNLQLLTDLLGGGNGSGGSYSSLKCTTASTFIIAGSSGAAYDLPIDNNAHVAVVGGVGDISIPTADEVTIDTAGDYIIWANVGAMNVSTVGMWLNTGGGYSLMERVDGDYTGVAGIISDVLTLAVGDTIKFTVTPYSSAGSSVPCQYTSTYVGNLTYLKAMFRRVD